MITIEDVAEKAGVSVATVSRVINNEFLVTKEKIQKVKEAIDELGYVPNSLRKKSLKKETKIIMVATSNIIDDMLSGISDAAQKYGYDIMLNYITKREGDAGNIVRYLENGTIDGVILINYFLNLEEIKLISEKYPLVQSGNCVKIPNACTVSINDERAGYELTNHLIGIGKKKIALVTTGVDTLFSVERKRGYQRALLEHNIPLDPELIIDTDHSFEGGTEAANRILNMQKEVDAIVCLYDLTAAGCLSALKSKQIAVPGQIAVSGFDNVEFTEAVEPKITTIAQPFYQIGYQSMRMLYSMISNDLNVVRKLYLDHELIIRKTTSLHIDADENDSPIGA